MSDRTKEEGDSAEIVSMATELVTASGALAKEAHADLLAASRPTILAGASSWVVQRLAYLAREQKILKELQAQVAELGQQTDPDRFARQLAQVEHMKGEVLALRGEKAP